MYVSMYVCMYVCIFCVCTCLYMCPCLCIVMLIYSLQETHVVAEDLRLCAVKNVQDMERRFCFEIVAPTK